MPLPRPHPGLVICYEFLWGHEHRAGATEGVKKRPCVVVLFIDDVMGAKGSSWRPSPIRNHNGPASASKCRAE